MTIEPRLLAFMEANNTGKPVLPKLQDDLREIGRLMRFMADAPNTRATPDQLRLVARQIDHIAANISRRPPLKRARPISARMTPATRRAIIDAYRANPSLSNRQLGERFNVDGGRVSEVLAGYRDGRMPK